MDAYKALREIPLRSIMNAFGIDMAQFKKRNGKDEWYGRCIFHPAQHNNTSFSFTDVKWYCFSCQSKGAGAIDFVKAHKKCSFTEAVEFLQSLHPTLATSEEKTGVHENPVIRLAYEKFFVPCPWLTERGLTEATLKEFGVGLYNNPARKSAYTGKVMLPIFRPTGEKVAYLARDISGEPGAVKYVFPKGFQKHLELFGAWQLLRQPGLALPIQVGFVVESPFSVLRFHQLGFSAVAPFGPHISPEQTDILRSLFRAVVFLPDNDKREKVESSVLLLAKKLLVSMPEFPAADPEHLTSEQVASLLP